MTRRTPIYSDVKWEAAPEGLHVYGGGNLIATIPSREFTVLILNVVKILKANTKSID
jgi:hypothetical protein